jgi:uncharacterized membrane protein
MTDEQKADRTFENAPESAAGSLSEHIDQNIESVAALERRERDMTSAPQRLVERISRIIGRPAYLVVLLAVVVAWVSANVLTPFGMTAFDPPPFELLDGVLTFSALVTATIVLIAQNRQTQREQQLRRDMPMVKDREDPQATVLQQATDTAAVVSAMEEVGLTHDGERERKNQP